MLKIGRLYDDIAFCYTVSRVCSYSSNLYVFLVFLGENYRVFEAGEGPFVGGGGNVYTPVKRVI